MDEDQIYLDDPVKVYLREVSKVPRMTHEEETICIEHVLANDEESESAGTCLVEANLYLVVEIAERFRHEEIHILDLIQKGNDGLLEALRGLGPNERDGFAKHATPYIERAIREAAPQEISPVHLRKA